jgi:hypothetical protein
VQVCCRCQQGGAEGVELCKWCSKNVFGKCRVGSRKELGGGGGAGS